MRENSNLVLGIIVGGLALCSIILGLAWKPSFGIFPSSHVVLRVSPNISFSETQIDDHSQSQTNLLNYIQDATHSNSSIDDSFAKLKPLWPMDWSHFDWIQDHDWKSLVHEISDIQTIFLRNISSGPQPLLYRPLLPGMGWGNLCYDISFHLLLAVVLKRPFLMMLDRKDPSGALGWNSLQNSSVLLHNIIDWRWGKPELVAKYPKSFVFPSPHHFIATCRAGTAFHSLCGGDQDQGNFDPLLAIFQQNPHKPIYSEFSASFIRPVMNSRVYRQWIETHLCKNHEHIWDCQLQFAFSILFKLDPTFRRINILPRLEELSLGFSSRFTVAHIRTGHLETGVGRGMDTLENDLLQLRECRLQDKNKWLVLTDSSELARRVSNWSMVTVETEFSLENNHVGYNVASHVAWENTLRDWFLIVESTGPTLLRSRMPSAFSFGLRGAIIGGKVCSSSNSPWLSCGSHFFDQVCVFKSK